MKKQSELSFGSKIKIDPLNQKHHPEKKKHKEDEEILNESDCDDEEYEEFDPNFLQELMKDDDKFTEMLIKTNDRAVQDIQAGNLKESLAVLERMERILEYAAINKKILDRNLVIVCLYNIACNYQAYNFPFTSHNNEPFPIECGYLINARNILMELYTIWIKA